MTSRSREQLLDRLASFSPARWAGEPLSALECARRGWRLEAGPVLRCSACEAAVSARLPAAGRPRLRAECVARLRRLVSESHRAGCRWSAPLSAGQLRPPLPDTGAGLARLAAAAIPLPTAGPPESLLEPETAAALLTEALGHHQHTDRARTALNYTLAGWELSDNERYLRCSFGCRTWDTTDRPPLPERGVLTAHTDTTRRALDQCRLGDPELEMSVPAAVEGEVSGQETDGHSLAEFCHNMRSDAVLRDEGDEEKEKNVNENAAAINSKGDSEFTEAERGDDGPSMERRQEEVAVCSEAGAEDTAGGAGGDAGTGPASDAGSPAMDGGGPNSAAQCAEVGSPSPAPGVSAAVPVSPEASQSAGSGGPAELGSVHSSSSAADDPHHSPLPPAAGGHPGPLPPEDDPSCESGEDTTSSPSLSSKRSAEGPLTCDGEQEPPALSPDEDSGPAEVDGSRRGGRQEGLEGPSPGSPEVIGGDDPVSAGGGCRGRSAGSLSSGGTGLAAAVEDGDGEAASDDGSSTEKPPQDRPATEALSPPASQASEGGPAPSDADPTSAAVDEQPRPGKRGACGAPAAGGVKRARRAAAGPLEGHRRWCPWVAGVDGGPPGWRQAVAALSAAGRQAGRPLWAGDAALDTMRRVWATLDQWSSPPAKSARA